MSREQELVDICFSIGLQMSEQSLSFDIMPVDEKADWIAKQLREAGFDTSPVGSSYGILNG